MTGPRAIQRETDLGPPVLAHLADHGLDCRTELPVTLAGQQVSPDIVARRETETGGYWWYCVVELKRRRSGELVEQALRWVGLSNQVLIAVAEPKAVSKQMRAMLDLCAQHGIGVLFVTSAGSVVTKVRSRHNAEADVRVIQRAFEQPGRELDPPAGSGGSPLPESSPQSPPVRRAIAARSRWQPATAYVQANPGSTWADIRRHAGLMFDATAAAAVKAIRKQEWFGVQVNERDAPATFWPAGDEQKSTTETRSH